MDSKLKPFLIKISAKIRRDEGKKRRIDEGKKRRIDEGSKPKISIIDVKET